MKQAFRFILLGVLWAVAGPAGAQQLGRSEAATAEQRLAEDIGPSWNNLPAPTLNNLQNLSSIIQKGDENKATTTQTNLGSFANQAFIQQVGSFNEAALTQKGSGNTTRISQNGNSNDVVSAVTGDDNTTTLTQNGDYNRILRDVTTNKADFTLTQLGNDNTIKQQGTEALAPPKYEVEMRGNGIQLTIEHSRVGP